jgi:hypothetical protein
MLGAVNWSEVSVTPLPTYRQTAELVNGDPVGAMATQSLALPGPLATVTVIALPGLTAVLDTVTDAAGRGSTVIRLLTPRSVKPSF